MIIMHTYKNSFYNPKYTGSKETLTSYVDPIPYNNHLIYNRIRSTQPDGDVFDVVKDGICISMYAGLNGAKGFIDSITSSKLLK